MQAKQQQERENNIMKHKIDKSVVMTGILSITALELTALMLGYDGLLLTTVIALIGTSIGLSLPQIKFKR